LRPCQRCHQLGLICVRLAPVFAVSDQDSRQWKTLQSLGDGEPGGTLGLPDGPHHVRNALRNSQQPTATRRQANHDTVVPLPSSVQRSQL
jgi:hypothetical protein